MNCKLLYGLVGIGLIALVSHGRCSSSTPKSFCIREGYKARTSYAHHDDTTFKDEYQDEVYLLARDLAIEKGYTRIVDIGCGSGFKLRKYFRDFDFTGYEIEPTLDWLKQNYPNQKWELSDFSSKELVQADIVLCCDVIEHLLDPDELLAWIKSMDCKVIILSTPDRGVLVKERKVKDSGPPVNPFHIREWNFDEFEKYISKWFDIVDHRCMKKQTECQVVVCIKKD